MLKIIITAAVFLSGFIGQAQVSENRRINDFSKLEVESGIELIYMQGSENSLRIETEKLDNLNNVITEMNGKTLRVYYANNSKVEENDNIIKVYVSGKNVNSFKAASKAKIIFKEPISSDEVYIEVQSGSSFTGVVLPNSKTTVKASSGSLFSGKFETDYFQGDFKSGATASLAGKAKKSVITTSTGAYCNAKNFFTEITIANARTSSSAILNAKKIDASAIDTSSITVFGTTEKVRTDKDSFVITHEKAKKTTGIAMQ